MGCFSACKTIQNNAHIGHGLAFRASWHITFVSPTNRTNPCAASKMRPLRLLGQSTSGKSAGASHWFGAHGAGPHIHPAVTVGGPHWHSVRVGLHVFLVLGQYFRIVVIVGLTVLATIAIAPLFVIIPTITAINRCTSPRSHIDTSIIPSPTTMGADPASACFFCRFSPYTPNMGRERTGENGVGVGTADFGRVTVKFGV